MKSSRILAAIAASSLSIGLLAGCSTAGGNDEGPVEISFLVFETPNLDAAFWDEAIGRFEAKNPDIIVNKIVTPDSDRNKYAQTLLSTGQFPDVQIALNAANFVDANALLPFDEAQLSDFLQPNSGAVDGKTYQTPWVSQGIPLMYYNEDLFAQAGIADLPTTWDELMATAEKLKAAGITPFQIGGSGADAWASAYLVQGLVSTNVYGADPDWILKRYAGDVSFQDPDFVDALSAFTDVVSSGYINTDALSLSYAQLQDSFLGGGAAMYPMGTWFSAAAAGADFPVGVMPFPAFDGNSVVPVFTGGGLTVSATSAHPEAAQKFAIEFSTDSDNLTAFLNADATFPMVKGYELPADLPEIVKQSYAITVDATDPVGVFAGESGDRALPAGFADTLFQAIQSMINGGSAADAAASLDAKWDELVG